MVAKRHDDLGKALFGSAGFTWLRHAHPNRVTRHSARPPAARNPTSATMRAAAQPQSSASAGTRATAANATKTALVPTTSSQSSGPRRGEGRGAPEASPPIPPPTQAGSPPQRGPSRPPASRPPRGAPPGAAGGAHAP